MTVIDLFCGCGGLSCGLKQAGLDVILGVDRWADALKVYRKNLGINTLKWNLSTVPPLPEASAIVGGSPCQDFSSEGSRVEAGRARLTIRFAETVAAHRPRLFALENVSGAICSDAYNLACCILHDAGYGLSEAILDAQYFSVPQTRRRLLLVGELGGRDDGLRDSLFAGRSERATTVREHCGHRLAVRYFYQTQQNAGGGQRCIWSVDEVGPTVRTVMPPLPPHYRPKPGDATTDLSQVRSLTLKETATILQTFPECWSWDGVRLRDARKMVGNAVPPKLAEHLGRMLLAAWEGRKQ